MRIFETLNDEIEKQASSLCLEYNDLTLCGGRINGYRVSPGVYASIHAFLSHQADLVRRPAPDKDGDRHGEIWLNFGGVSLDNDRVKRFNVALSRDGELRLKASLVTIANGQAPFENGDLALLCCGNHCSSGCYDITGGGD